MSKYSLVASYYDKSSNTYKNEIKIKELNNKKFTSLFEIDLFTSSHSREELFSIIKKEYGVNEINHLSIRFKKWNSEEYDYLSVIVDDKIFLNCISSVEKTNKFILDKNRNTEFISQNNELYKKELNNLFIMIKDGSFFEYYNRNNDLTKLINRYNQTKSSNEEELYERNKILRFLSLEFSRYKTFRGWYVLSFKKRIKTIPNKYEINTSKQTSKSKIEKIMSIEENIGMYEKTYKEKYGISYEENKLNEYNEENEEYLDEEDYNQMYDYDNSEFVRRRR